jgi:hypothetical protein
MFHKGGKLEGEFLKILPPEIRAADFELISGSG